MKKYRHLILLSFAICIGCTQQGPPHEQNPRYTYKQTFSLDNFEDRIMERIDFLAPDIVEYYLEYESEDCKAYAPTKEEIDFLVQEASALPTLQKMFFLKIIRIAFIENSKSTARVIPLGNGYSALVLNPRIFKEDIIQYLDRADNNFHINDDGPAISYKCTKDISGLTVTLLHELAHVVNAFFRHMNEENANEQLLSAPLQDTWEEPLWKSFHEPVSNEFTSFDFQFAHMPGSKPREYSTDEMLQIAKTLKESPFPTLYATENQEEDFAELMLLYSLFHDYEADLIFRIKDKGKIIEEFSLMDRDFIQLRFLYLEGILYSQK